MYCCHASNFPQRYLAKISINLLRRCEAIHSFTMYFSPSYARLTTNDCGGGNDMHLEQQPSQHGLSGSNQMNASWMLFNRTLLKMSPCSSALTCPMFWDFDLPWMRWQFSCKLKIQRDLLTEKITVHTSRSALQSSWPRRAGKHSTLSHQGLRPN